MSLVLICAELYPNGFPLDFSLFFFNYKFLLVKANMYKSCRTGQPKPHYGHVTTWILLISFKYFQGLWWIIGIIKSVSFKNKAFEE